MTAAAAGVAALAALTAVPAQAHGPAHQDRAPHWSLKDTGAPTCGSAVWPPSAGTPRGWPDPRHRAAHHRRRTDLAGRVAARRGRVAVPGRRGVRRAPGRGAGHRGGRGLPRLPHRRRRNHLDRDLPQPGRPRVLRLPHLLRPPPRTRHERPRGGEVPHPVDPRRRPLLDRAPRHRHAPGAGGRGRLRRERPVPGVVRAEGRLAGHRGAARARVLHSADRGRTWTATDAPIPAGDPARGVFALAFRDRHHGLAVGGDFSPGLPSPDAAARTTDGGRGWRPPRDPRRPTAPASPGSRTAAPPPSPSAPPAPT